MKGRSIYIVCILLFLLLMFAIEYNAPKEYVWIPTFNRYDKQPFGCAVFDDVVAASLPGEYSVTDETIYQLSLESERNKGFLIVAERLNLTDTDVDAMLSLAERGCRFLLVASRTDSPLTDTLKYRHLGGYYSFHDLRQYIALGLQRDSITWRKDALYGERLFTIYPHLCGGWFQVNDTIHTVLSTKKGSPVYLEDTDSTMIQVDDLPLAFRQKVGNGSVTLATVPLLFTNYGMLDQDNSDYIFRLLTEMKDLPVIRSEAYTGVKHEEQSPLRYFLSQPPLRWGVYLSMAAILLFMIFTSRRRQRAIPVLGKPVNRSVEFAELIATLYLRKKDHADLVRKKYMYFSEMLRRTIQVDLANENEDYSSTRRIAMKTGMDEDKIRKLIQDIRRGQDAGTRMTEAQMKDIIDRTNEIMKQLKV